MSNVIAPASSDEQPSRAWELTNEIEKKLAQAYGICNAMMHLQDVDELIADPLWAASDLIGDALKAFKELNHLTKGKPVPCDAPPINPTDKKEGGGPPPEPASSPS